MLICKVDLFKMQKKNVLLTLNQRSPLYGFNREDQESIRVMEYGLLKADQWVDRRLVIQPPGKTVKSV